VSTGTGTGHVRPWRRAAIESSGSIPAGAGSGYSKPEPPPKEKPPRLFPPLPPQKFCIRRHEPDRDPGRRPRSRGGSGPKWWHCSVSFPAETPGECCPACAADLLEEAELNGLDITLPHSVLAETLKEIARLDSAVVLHSFAAAQAQESGAPRAARHQRARAILRERERASLIRKAGTA
jgi:hypothetical protein